MRLCVTFLLIITAIYGSNAQQKTYKKTYYNTGQLKSEGWVLNELPHDYWAYYYQNGKKKSEGSYSNGERTGYWYFWNNEGNLLREGHYNQDQRVQWWTFYDLAKQTESRCQCSENIREGFCLIYKKGRLKRVDQYEKDRLIGSWNNIRAFKKDNPQVRF